MTVSAGESFSRAVIGVAEGITIGARVGGRRPVSFAIVTDTARRNLAARRCFARRGVTRVAAVMCGQIRRD